MLHGRAAPLALLREALDGAIGGRGRLALVTGEAGIGKSAIAAELGRDAEARGAVVTWGRAWEFADAPPYFPVWTCLRALGLPTGDRGEPFQLWEEVLARVSAGAPAVWILEDLHAADLGTLDLLAYLVQPVRATKLLVVATARGHDPRLTERMLQRLGRMARDGLDVRLEPLAGTDVAALTAELVGRAVPAAALPRIVELTGGNPLFVVECARAFRSAGGVEGTLESLPPTIRQVVIDRVGHLAEAARDALAAGAVLGREFAAATVARMTDTLPARVIDAVLPALRAGLIKETRPGQFLFSHTLVRDAIEDALAPSPRAALHARAAAALAAGGDTAEILVERARHALAALRGGDDTAEALALVARAGQLLEQANAFDRAFELHARLAELRAAGLLPPASPEQLLHAARLSRAAGRSDASKRLCEDAIAATRIAGNAELFARAVLLHAADVRPGVIDRAQLELIAEARAVLGDAHPALACRVLVRLAAALQPAPDPSIPAAYAREAIARARATGDDATLLDVLDLAGWGFAYEPAEVLRVWATELRDRALAASDLPRAISGELWLAFDALEAGEFGAFDRTTTRLLALADEVGHPRHRWRALLVASTRAVTGGHFAESERYLTEVEQLAAVVDDPSLPLSLAMHQLVCTLTMRRDERPHLAAFERAAMTVHEPDLMIGVMRATCAARRGDVDVVGAELAQIGGRAASLVATPLAKLGEACARAGSDELRRTVRAGLARSRAPIVSGSLMAFTYDGTVARVLGLLDGALGDLAGAEAQLREAYTLAVANAHPAWAAQVGTELAAVVERGGHPTEAARLRADALAIARRLGMSELEAELVASRPEPAAVPAAAPLELAREGEVWRLSRGAGVARVKDSRGVQLLARLIERPGEEIHVLALAGDGGASAPETSAGVALDDRARRDYRRRLSELDDELAAAEAAGDGRRAARLEREKSALVDELARATGLGGRARQTGSATERARVNVQKRLKDAIARVADANADLGKYLDKAVQTGTFCCYRPA